MSLRDLIKNTFLDDDGSLCLPEMGALTHGGTVLAGSIAVICAFIRQVWLKDQTPDYMGFAAALASLAASTGIIVAALGKAMQWRKGQPVRGERDADDH